MIQKDYEQGQSHIKSVNNLMKDKVLSLVNHYEEHPIVGDDKKSPETLEPETVVFTKLQNVMLVNQDLKKEWLLNN
jgi:hypothetical protein